MKHYAIIKENRQNKMKIIENVTTSYVLCLAILAFQPFSDPKNKRYIVKV